MKFRIVKRDNAECFLWIFPNKDRVWGTEKEIAELLAPGKAPFIVFGVDARDAKAQCKTEFDGDFAAHFCSMFPNVAIVEAEGNKSYEEEMHKDYLARMGIFVAGIVLGAMLASWLISG